MNILNLKHLKQDASAGFVVFLVALPLCLGIALASKAPLSAGLISGIIAGLVVSFASGSALSVSGPAAGLTLIVAGAITELGSYEAFLLAVVLSGLFQILFGILKSGVVASFVPHSVIKGMLAAIGLIIILKQVPHAVGWDFDYEGDESFHEISQHTESNTFTTLIHAAERIDRGALFISLLSFLGLLIWNRKFIQNHRMLSIIPGPLIAVLFGIFANVLLSKIAPELWFAPGSHHLVNIPDNGINSLLSAVSFPQWSAVTNLVVWKTALVLAAVASIESLLSVEATDKLDPERRISDSNRELLAQGLGNTICGFIGGLPMTSVIVRSSANVYAGGKTNLACFFHGVYLLIAVLIGASFINQIPLACLAIILISVGWKLVSLKIFKEMYRDGLEQFIPFAITIVSIVLTDLLTGVLLGLVIGIVIVIRMNHHSAMTLVADGDQYLLRFAKDVSFANKPALKAILHKLPDHCHVTIDGTGAQYIDHDIIEEIQNFCEGAEHRFIKVYLKNMRTKRLSLKGVQDGKLQEPLTSK